MNSTLKGDQFEERVFDDLRSLIENNEFYIRKEFCKIYRKKKYYSRVRGTDIEFDVSIEVFLPGIDTCSILILIECKNYGHSIPVDDIEEFINKVGQVSGHNIKGIFATASALQSGARKVAEHYKLGHIRYFSEANFKWELPRTPSGALVTSLSPREIAHAIVSDEYESRVFDYFMWSASGYTNSIFQFFKELIAGQGDLSEQLLHITHPKSINNVPFLSKSDLEGLATTFLTEARYKEGRVILNNLHKSLSILKHTRVQRGCSRPDGLRYEGFLARADFQRFTIEVYSQEHENIKRERFTVAHEFAHFLLGHNQYMHREMCEEQDFLLSSPIGPISDIARMEFQANHLASCILMPSENFYYSFLTLARRHRLYRSGKAILYVDRQGCNLQLFKTVTSILARNFEVTRRMVAIRLGGMGLLKDDRQLNSLPLTELLGDVRRF